LEIKAPKEIIDKFNKTSFLLIYGENTDLIRFYTGELVSYLKRKKLKIIYKDQNDIINNQDIYVNELINSSLFNEKICLIIKHCNEKIINFLEKIKNKDPENYIILNSEILVKKSKLRIYFEENKLLENIVCYFENETYLQNYIIEKNFKLPRPFSQIEFKNLDIKKLKSRSEIDDFFEKINLLQKNKENLNNINEILISYQNEAFDLNFFEKLLNKKDQYLLNFLKENISTEQVFEIILKFKNLINKMILILKSNNGKSVQEKIDNYPNLFWKDKISIKKILKQWKYNDIINLNLKLNMLETNIKTIKIDETIYVKNFLIKNLT